MKGCVGLATHNGRDIHGMHNSPPQLRRGVVFAYFVVKA
jgi:hypothetical protein